MVNQNLKAGDVCLITGAISLTQNIGKTCTINCIVKHGEWFNTPEGNRGQFWSKRGAEGCVVSGNGLVQSITKFTNWVIVKPEHLMKIDGHKSSNEEKLSIILKSQLSKPQKA